ncbi:MAG: preprotein translocase subunit SecY [Lachnospiraceae bacterium]|nr:preprotein translocase subunit SecY [uncultured Acetatifactor sp.]MCI9220366.1 preprotein translocase subunit SecY [Lachnospiraceae bacterium]
MKQVEENEKVTKYKLLFTAIILAVYTAGRFIPLYGVNTAVYQGSRVDADSLLMQVIGGDSYQYSIFALGISPYIISNLVSQLGILGMSSDYKAKMSPRKIQRIMLAGMLGLCIVQSFLKINGLEFVGEGNILYLLKTVAFLELIVGAMLIFWISELNKKYGIGGATVVILFNISSGITNIVRGHTGKEMLIPLLLSAVMFLIMLILENTEKRIPLQRVSIHNIYADKNYMAIKSNPVGVMPVMFSTAFFMLPRLLVDLLCFISPQNGNLAWWRDNLVLTKPLGLMIYLAIIYLLTIGFAMLLINPKDTMEQFLKSGDSIVDLHAGRPTRRYIRKTLFRMSFFSATVMCVCLGLPLLLQILGKIESTLSMLPSSIMMLSGLMCSFGREIVAIHSYDVYDHFIFI